MSGVESDRALHPPIRPPISVETPPSSAPTAPDGDHSQGAARWGRYGRRPVTLLAAVAFIDAVDKGILPGVLSLVKDDLGLSDFQLGTLGTAYIIASLLVMLPAGYLADTVSRTRLIAVTLLSWGGISALNAGVRNFGQFLAVRAALGGGEMINHPAAQSLISDYYPARIRGRAFGLQRIAPTIGTAVGLGLGGLVGSLLGWRWAFLVVGGPGSLVALAVWRMHEPRRGESDEEDALAAADGKVESTSTTKGTTEGKGSEADGQGSTGAGGESKATRQMVRNVRAVARVPTLRSLMIGIGVAQGATAGIAFWAAAYHERHSDLSGGAAAGVTSGLLLCGALLGNWLGGMAADKARTRSESGPMLVAGVAQLVGSGVMFVSFLPLPVWPVRIPLQIVAVMLIVGAFPSLMAMVSEVVTAKLRGAAFSMATLLGALLAAASPMLMGLVADAFPVIRDGESVGNLGIAFMFFAPGVAVGAAIVLAGRRHAADDIAAARRALALEAAGALA